MDIRLPIRLSIVEGESFSGYIMRAAMAMNVDCKELLKYIISNYNIHYKLKNNRISLPYSRIASSIDVFPFGILRENDICFMFNKSKKEIENSTFKNVFDILNVNYDEGKDLYKMYLNMELVKDVRRFCPLCLKENGVYKLMWQVKELEICEIHKIKLVSHCGVCNSKQRYFSTSLGNYRCINCDSFLWEKVNRDKFNISQLNEQTLIYSDWKFLLNYENKLVKLIPHYDFSQSLAITMLYVAQNQEDIFQIENIKLFPKRTVNKIVRFINNMRIEDNISLNSVKRIARDKNILLSSLHNIKVPMSYIQSLIKQRKKIIEFTCLSPWCKFFGKNDKIDVLGKYNSKCRGIVKKFVCTECNMRFGYNLRTNMCEPLNQTLFNNILKVKEMNLKDKVQREIAEFLGISIDLYTKILAYLLSNSLMSSNVESHNRIIIPSDVKEKFKMLLDKKCLSVKKARKIFGWSYFQFYYYYWLPEIQGFLIDEEKCSGLRISQYRPNKREWKKILFIYIYYFWKRDIDINFENIDRYSKISWNILNKYNLIEAVKISAMFQNNKRRIESHAYVIKKIINFLDDSKYKKVFLKDLLSKAKISQIYLKRHYPDLEKYLVRKVREHNLNVKKQKIEYYKEEIKKIYLRSIENGELETVKSISLKLGERAKFIYENTELNDFAKKLLEYGINTKSDN